MIDNLPNRFSKDYLAPGFAGQSWMSWVLLFFLFVSVTMLATAIDAWVLSKAVRARV